MFPYWYTYKSFTIGLGGGLKLFERCPREFHFISSNKFFETTSAKHIDGGGGGGGGGSGGVT